MIKFVFRWAFRLVVLAIVLGIGLVLLKDPFLREVAESRLRAQTGFEVRIGSLNAGLTEPVLHLRDVTIYNTADFGGSPFIRLKECHIEYDRKELAFQRLTIKLLRLDVEEFTVVENQREAMNLPDIWKAAQNYLPGGQMRLGSKNLEFKGIDQLNLSIGTLRRVNLGRPERERTHPMNVRNDITSNIRSSQDVEALILKLMLRQGITVMRDNRAQNGAVQAPPLASGQR
jgi:hypothetical protein